MSREIAPYRSYCPCCCNYRILHRFVTRHYFCSRCTRRITRELRMQHIEPRSNSPDLTTIHAAMDQIVPVLQTEYVSELKTTRWSYQIGARSWRSSRKQSNKPS